MWSLGVTFYELITLKKAFPQQDLIKLRQATVQHDIPKIEGPWSHQLQKILETLLSKDRKERPSARQICESEVVQKAVQEKFGITEEYDDVETESVRYLK